MKNLYVVYFIALMTSVLAGCNWGATANQQRQAAPSSETPAKVDSAAGDVASFAHGNHTRDEDLLGVGVGDASRNPQRAVADPYYFTGQALPEWQLAEWANSDPLTLESLRGRVVVVHFWTDDSRRSMQAMEQLADEFRMRDVTFVGIYFSQGRVVERDWRIVEGQAKQWDVTFPLAYDRQWRTLTEWWLAHYDNLPLTPTLVIDPAGEAIHLHPGPTFYPSDDPVEKLCDEDFQAIRAAIGRGLAGQLAESRPPR